MWWDEEPKKNFIPTCQKFRAIKRDDRLVYKPFLFGLVPKYVRKYQDIALLFYQDQENRMYSPDILNLFVFPVHQG